MTDIDTAIRAIADHKRDLMSRIELLEQADANADLVITMLAGALREVMIIGATTKNRRDRCKSALAFAAAHLGEDEAA